MNTISILAYIDPGIGSLAAQAILAGFAAFMMFFKNNILGFFKKSKPEGKEDERKEQE